MKLFRLLNTVVNGAIAIGMYWNSIKFRRPLIQASKNTENAQHSVLMRILLENAETEFGKKHNFSDIKNFNEYRKSVPIQSYDKLEPYIIRQTQGISALTSASPVYYARTSGTTGRSKDIPLTHYGLSQVQHSQKNLALSLWRSTNFFKGRILGFASPAEEGKLDNGKVYGSVSGSTYKSLSPILATKFIMPSQAFSIKNADAKYQTYALAVLAEENLTGLVSANPSSVLKLARLLEKDYSRFIDALTGKELNWLEQEAKEIIPEIRKRLTKKRRADLLAMSTNSSKFDVKDIWPNLSAIATWTGGSCGVALSQLQKYIPSRTQYVEYGYGASEFMGTVNIDADANHCLPQLNQHFYEFVERSNWEAGVPHFLLLEELITGEEYYVFVTTASGLYRYHINDIVRADSIVGNCPTLSFLQKGRGVTNITGEKLSEHQLISSVAKALTSLNIEGGFFIALADEEASRYVLYIETNHPNFVNELALTVDKYLRELNSEYDDKRASGRLNTPLLYILEENAADIIKQWSLERGVREAQYKPTILAYARDWADKLFPLVRSF